MQRGLFPKKIRGIENKMCGTTLKCSITHVTTAFCH